jgi:hypothetical protein
LPRGADPAPRGRADADADAEVADAVTGVSEDSGGGGGMTASTGEGEVAVGRVTRSVPRDDHMVAMPTTAPMATARAAT